MTHADLLAEAGLGRRGRDTIGCQVVNSGTPYAASSTASSRLLVWLAAVAIVCSRNSRRVASAACWSARTRSVMSWAVPPIFAGLPSGVALDAAEAADPAFLAAVADDPAVPGELVLALEDRRHRGLDDRSVLGVDELAGTPAYVASNSSGSTL